MWSRTRPRTFRGPGGPLPRVVNTFLPLFPLFSGSFLKIFPRERRSPRPLHAVATPTACSQGHAHHVLRRPRPLLLPGPRPPCAPAATAAVFVVSICSCCPHGPRRAGQAQGRLPHFGIPESPRATCHRTCSRAPPSPLPEPQHPAGAGQEGQPSDKGHLGPKPPSSSTRWLGLAGRVRPPWSVARPPEFG